MPISTGPDHKTPIEDLERAGLPVTEENLRYGIPSKMGSTALNIGALLALADVEPERNPRNEAGEVLANLYREVGRLKNRVSYLEQNS